MTQRPAKDYWFPARRFGWGWGPPQTWQGWVVTVVFLAAMAVVCFRVPPWRNTPLFLLLVTVGSAAFALICWLTGEPPQWRWGDREDGDLR
jgi:hypothetical protein